MSREKTQQQTMSAVLRRSRVYGGGTVSGKAYDKKVCYIMALKLNNKDAHAWHNLGNEGGGTVSGTAYDKKVCYIMALESNNKHAHAWHNLGIEGGGKVGVAFKVQQGTP